MEDILRRLGNVEAQVSAILAIIPHLATKADVADIPHLATKADVTGGVGQLKADMAAMETAIIKWIIATVLTTAGIAFSIAKFVH